MTISRASNSSLYTVNQGIVGFGNWASVTATTGSPTTGTYTDANGVAWKWYRWTSSASVTLTAGVIDVLLVGGGSGYHNVWAGGGDLDDQPGGGGDVQAGAYVVPSGTSTVTVGAGGAANNYPWGCPGSASSIGSVATRCGRLYGMNSNGLNTPVTSSITGTSTTYAAGGFSKPSSSGFGDGANTGSGSGTAGAVILRVPSTFALA